MRETETERLRSIEKRAREGDLKSGRKLISACRRGMLCPYWEDRDKKADRKTMEGHLKRRAGISGGRAMK